MQGRRLGLVLLGGAAMAVLGAAARADQQGETALREACKTLAAAKSLSADMTLSVNVSGQKQEMKGTLAVLKPNYLRVDLKGPESMLFVADGKNFYQLEGSTYQKGALDKSFEAVDGPWQAEVNAFFRGDTVMKGQTVTHAGAAKVDGVDCDQVRVEGKSGEPKVVYSIGKKDHLIRQAVMTVGGSGGPAITVTNHLTNLRLNVPHKATEFAFVPPKGAKLFERPDYEAKLVKVGEVAPRFVAPAPTGGEVSLSDGIKGKKALIVNFWFYG